MNLQNVVAVLETTEKEAIQVLLEDEAAVFWVDWREEDDAIVGYCEAILQTDSLSAELAEIETKEGYEIHVQYRNKRIRVPLTYSLDDRHITICALNDALAPDYEVRFCIDSNGSDTLAFLPLPQNTWRTLEKSYGEKVSKHFYQLTATPNLFTGSLPSEWP